jgi:VWFA-related protein
MRAISVTLMLLMASTAAAQAPDLDFPPPLPSDLVEEVEVRVLEVAIVAVDAQGKAVTGLRPEDLQVRLGRKPHRVAYLDAALSGVPAGRLPRLQLLLRSGEGYEITPTLSREPRYWVLFVDTETTEPTQSDAASERMRLLARERLNPEDRLAVVAYNGNLILEQGFTADREAIDAALASAFERPAARATLRKGQIRGLIEEAESCVQLTESGDLPAGEPSLAAPGVFTPDLTCLEAVAIRYQTEQGARAYALLSALEGTIRMAAGLTGGATVIAYSHGVTFDPTLEIMEGFRAVYGTSGDDIQHRIVTDLRIFKQLDQVIDLAVRERVAFHFIDSTDEPPPFYAASARGMILEGYRPSTTAWESAQVGLRTIAGATGGSFQRERDLLRGIDQAMEAEGARYFLGVYLDSPLRGRRMPRVDVNTTRPGVSLSVGKGVRPKAGAFESASGKISTGAPILREGTGDILLPFLIGFRVRDLDYQVQEGRLVAGLSLQVVVQTPDGTHLTSSYKMLEHSLRQAGGGEDEGVLAVRGGLEAPPGEYRVLAYVRNLLTGKGAKASLEIDLGGGGPGAAGDRRGFAP